MFCLLFSVYYFLLGPLLGALEFSYIYLKYTRVSLSPPRLQSRDRRKMSKMDVVRVRNVTPALCY